ncbi:MAG: hypothetical protein DMF00_10675 [Verrucomicrobia bacterium]|nr:MAG: hypothetical protein DMF00_10675 [Verrucomicrobiota bacterium]
MHLTETMQMTQFPWLEPIVQEKQKSSKGRRAGRIASQRARFTRYLKSPLALRNVRNADCVM